MKTVYSTEELSELINNSEEGVIIKVEIETQEEKPKQTLQGGGVVWRLN